MRNEPQEMREIHEIRLQISEETKGLSPRQRAERTNKRAAEIARHYNLKFSGTAKEHITDKPFMPV